MLKGSLKSILVIFFQRKDACDLTASTNHGMPDGNEDKLINDGAVAVVNCCCKHEFSCKWNCWWNSFSCLLVEILEQSVVWALQASLGGHSHDCAFTWTWNPVHPNLHSQCFGAGRLGAWESSDPADQVRRWDNARQPRGKMFTQPRRSACWMPCCICCCGRLISTSFPSARKKMEKKGCKVYSESLIYL